MSSRTKNASPPFTLAGQGQVPAGPHQGLLQSRHRWLDGGTAREQDRLRPRLASGWCQRQGVQDAVQEAAGPEAGSLLLPEGSQGLPDGQALEVDAALDVHQGSLIVKMCIFVLISILSAQPQVHPVLQVQEGVRGQDRRGGGQHRLRYRSQGEGAGRSQRPCQPEERHHSGPQVWR